MRYPYDDSLRLPHACSDMMREVVDGNSPLWYLPWAREYLLERHSGGFSQVLACPFCAAVLPDSLREPYFEAFPDAESVGWSVDGDSWWRSDAQYEMPTTPAAAEVPGTYLRTVSGEEIRLVDHLVTTAGMSGLVGGLRHDVVVEVGSRGEYIKLPKRDTIESTVDFEDESGDLSLTIGITGGAVARIDFWTRPTEWWWRTPGPQAWKKVG